MNSDTFNAARTPSEWPLFTAVADVRPKFEPGTKIMVAIGGWGDTAGFEAAARHEASRRTWAGNVAAMVRDTGADGRLAFCRHPVNLRPRASATWIVPVTNDIGQELILIGSIQGRKSAVSRHLFKYLLQPAATAKTTSAFPTKTKPGRSTHTRSSSARSVQPSGRTSSSPPRCRVWNATWWLSRRPPPPPSSRSSTF